MRQVIRYGTSTYLLTSYPETKWQRLLFGAAIIRDGERLLGGQVYDGLGIFDTEAAARQRIADHAKAQGNYTP